MRRPVSISPPKYLWGLLSRRGLESPRLPEKRLENIFSRRRLWEIFLPFCVLIFFWWNFRNNNFIERYLLIIFFRTLFHLQLLWISQLHQASHNVEQVSPRLQCQRCEAILFSKFVTKDGFFHLFQLDGPEASNPDERSNDVCEDGAEKLELLTSHTLNEADHYEREPFFSDNYSDSFPHLLPSCHLIVLPFSCFSRINMFKHPPLAIFCDRLEREQGGFSPDFLSVNCQDVNLRWYINCHIKCHNHKCQDPSIFIVKIY